jgi:hypothetical protein
MLTIRYACRLWCQLDGQCLQVARLSVSGAFHTSLMEPAREALMQVRGTVPPRYVILRAVLCHNASR